MFQVKHIWIPYHYMMMMMRQKGESEILLLSTIYFFPSNQYFNSLSLLGKGNYISILPYMQYGQRYLLLDLWQQQIMKLSPHDYGSPPPSSHLIDEFKRVPLFSLMVRRKPYFSIRHTSPRLPWETLWCMLGFLVNFSYI